MNYRAALSVFDASIFCGFLVNLVYKLISFGLSPLALYFVCKSTVAGGRASDAARALSFCCHRSLPVVWIHLGALRCSVCWMRRWHVANPAAATSYTGFCAQRFAIFPDDKTANYQLGNRSVRTTDQQFFGIRAGDP
jgi:hypothetical protein